MYKDVDLSSHFKIKSLYSAFRDKKDSTYFFDGERHNLWEFVIAMEGKIGVTAGSDAFVLKKGQAIIHEPWEFHRLWSEGGACEFIVFTFTAENMPLYSSKIFEISDMDAIDNLIKEIRTVYEAQGGNIVASPKANDIKCQIATKKLEIFLLDTIFKKASINNITRTKTAKSYAMAINILENNLDKSLSVDEIAALCNMSKANLSKIFSKYSGMGVIAYYNQMKINAAIPMLKSNMPIKQVAETMGFENQNYFCTVFKRIKGKAPSHYR